MKALDFCRAHHILCGASPATDVLYVPLSYCLARRYVVDGPRRGFKFIESGRIRLSTTSMDGSAVCSCAIVKSSPSMRRHPRFQGPGAGHCMNGAQLSAKLFFGLPSPHDIRHQPQLPSTHLKEPTKSQSDPQALRNVSSCCSQLTAGFPFIFDWAP